MKKELTIDVDGVNVKWIPGYENLYAARIDGQIISYKTSNPKIIKGNPNEKGYLKVNLIKDKKTRTRRVHRLIAMAFHECEDFDKYEVDHIDFNKTNNSASNLRWVTGQENIDAYIEKKYGKNKIKNLERKKQINIKIVKLREEINRLIIERDRL